MTDSLNELSKNPKDPNSPESVKIKKEFWNKMSDYFEHTKSMIEGWSKEDKKNEIK